MKIKGRRKGAWRVERHMKGFGRGFLCCTEILAVEFSGKHLNSKKSFFLSGFHFNKQDLLNQFWGASEISKWWRRDFICITRFLFKEHCEWWLISPSQQPWEPWNYSRRNFPVLQLRNWDTERWKQFFRSISVWAPTCDGEEWFQKHWVPTSRNWAAEIPHLGES